MPKKPETLQQMQALIERHFREAFADQSANIPDFDATVKRAAEGFLLNLVEFAIGRWAHYIHEDRAFVETTTIPEEDS